MICLRFGIGKNFYGFEYDRIAEIVPWVPLRRIEGAPEYVPGCFNYRGRIVPVIDLSMLAAGQTARPVLSSRIAVVRYREKHLLGLLMESVTEIVDMASDPARWQSPGIKTDKDYMEQMIVENETVLQLVNTEKLLPEEVQSIIFTND